MGESDELVFWRALEFLLRLFVGGFIVLWLGLEVFIQTHVGEQLWMRIAFASVLLLWSGTFRAFRDRS